MRDNWNIAEKYYEPETEFMYFDDATDLEKKIKEILNNWSDYEEMLHKAYERSLSYTTDNFIKTIREDT
jgi:hypothetical protein